MQIRDAVINDLPDILNIYNRAVLTSAATFDIEEQTIEQRMAWFSRHGGKYPLIVAEKEGHVAGYCCLSPFREKPAYAKTVESSVYIEEPYWGQGIGKALMTEILRRAAEIGHHSVIAAITGSNEASIRLHLKLGFKLAGCLREAGYKFGAWHDVHYYQLLLPRDG